MSEGATVVVPTIGRPSLRRLLDELDGRIDVVVVDDRRHPHPPLDVGGGRVRVVATSGGDGPAAARNVGWRSVDTEWVAFLDDDIVPSPDWVGKLGVDLDRCGPGVAATQGQVEVPLPNHRRPTDRERNVAGLETARWITADMAYRRKVLLCLGGFDERFRRAYREDSDLALRAVEAGWEIAGGSRRVLHPVTRAPWWGSVTSQRGNRDDVMMSRLHGPGWRRRTGEGPGRIRRHIATTTALAAIPFAVAAGRRLSAITAALVWAGLSGRFTWERIRLGPKEPGEIATMVATSIAIPPAAVFWRTVGQVADRSLSYRPAPADDIAAVLFDRDGTLIHDVPYNDDPDAVRPVAGAKEALDEIRAAGVPVGIVSNQSGIGRGIIDAGRAEAVMERVESLLGPFEAVVYCPHSPEDECRCRKPAPGLVIEAARRIRVDPGRCVVIGDILTDVLAAEAAGARAILVPNGATAPGEARAAPYVAPDLHDAASLIQSWRRR